MKTLVVSFGLLIAFAACSGNSKGVGTSAARVGTTTGTVNLGDACGGSDPAAASCDGSKNLYCQQDPAADPSAPGKCGSCADLEPASLVCNDGTIQPGQWVAIDQTCQIIGCGEAQLGDACDDSAADPLVTCAFPLVCAQSSAGQNGVCADTAGTASDDAGAPQTDDAGTGQDADPGSTTGDVDADVDAGVDTSDGGGTPQAPQLFHVGSRLRMRN